MLALTTLVAIALAFVLRRAPNTTLWERRLGAAWRISAVALLALGLASVAATLASPSTDRADLDTNFLVFGTLYLLIAPMLCAAFALLYSWFPSLTGRRAPISGGFAHLAVLTTSGVLALAPPLGGSAPSAAFDPYRAAADALSLWAGGLFVGSFVVFLVVLVWAFTLGERASA